MGPETHAESSATGAGHVNSFNQTNSNNITTNITYVDQKTKLLNWLSHLQPTVRHNDVRARRQDGLGEWFLRADEFLRWRDGKDGVDRATLFGSGNPGVGKTFLCSLVIDRLLDHFVGKDVAVACLYCDFQDQEGQTAASMIGALTKQLVNALRIVPAEIEEAFERAEGEVGGRRPQVSEIVKLLQAALAPVKRTFICIDALDECPDKHLSQLLTSLHKISQASPGVRLFITGRPHIRSAVGKCLLGVQVIPISPSSKDIREYLEMELKHDLNSEAMSPVLKADIMKRIPEKIRDTFLLVSLSIAAVLGEATILKRQERLGIMTSGLGLDGAYDAALDRIKGQDKGKSVLGVAALMWVSRSEHPLHIGELCEALAVEIGSRDLEHDNIPSTNQLLASCLGLVTVDKSSIVRLVHFTLQEYLNRHSEHFESPQSTMAEVCLTYLNFDSVNKLSHTLVRAPVGARFLQYASRYWGFYARNGLTEGVKSLALQLLNKFGRHISAELLFEGDYVVRHRGPRHSEGFTGLHCAAYLGLDEIAIALLEMRGCDADMADGWGRTPLMWAAEGGHERIVKLLLDRKEVDPDSRDYYGRTPLRRAAGGGHKGMVKLLLGRKKANLDSRGKHGQSPLSLAVGGGHEAVVKLLLSRKEVNPNSRGEHGQSLLFLAAKGGHEGVVELLLGRKGVNPDVGDDDGRTPLLCAASGGHEGIVKLLLDRKEVNPNSRDNRDHQTPLMCALEGGHEGIVKLLLDRKDVNPDLRCHDSHRKLWWAARGGHGGIVKPPLDRREVNPDLRCDDSHRQLWWAARGGHEGTVKLLLDRKEVNPDFRNHHDRTPLSYAAAGGHEGIVELLLGREGVDPNSKGRYERTPLWCAARGGHEGIVKLLLDRKEVNPDLADDDGRTPLFCAASGGHEGIVKLLLDRKEVNPNSKDKYGQTPLWCAASGGHEGIVKVLLDRKRPTPT